MVNNRNLRRSNRLRNPGIDPNVPDLRCAATPELRGLNRFVGAPEPIVEAPLVAVDVVVSEPIVEEPTVVVGVAETRFVGAPEPIVEAPLAVDVVVSELIVEEPPVVAGVTETETRFVGAPEPIVEAPLVSVDVSEPIANTAATFVLEPIAEESTAAPAPNPTTTTTTTTDAAEDDENKPVKEEESTATFEPVIQLEEVEVKSGTEEEETLHTFRAKLFILSNMKWKERGIGDACILRHRDNGRLRFLMRQEKTLKVIANHALNPHTVLEPNADSDRSWLWVCNDFADGVSEEKTFAARFANSELANDFKNKFEECQKDMARS